jgi:L-aminopeptidase/D-esterase-like protein
MTQTPCLTDIEGLWVGHYTLRKRPTGCTVISGRKSFVAGVDVRGGAPGGRETELLKPENSVDRIDAIFLSGGSAFGLDVGAGIVRFLEERKRGFNTGVARVPIVCGAILYDLRLGDPKVRPDAKAGYAAMRAARHGPVPEGSVGAGAGATVGKMMGMERAMRGGLGSWAIAVPGGLKVGALAVVNAIGNVVNPKTGETVAGVRRSDRKDFVDVMAEIRKGFQPGFPFKGNTVIGVVATNANLTKTECTQVARVAHDGLARSVCPAHTPWDGDTVFAISTGSWGRREKSDVGIVGALAAESLAVAIVRGVMNAKSWGPYPSASEYKGQQCE